jgi:hypothetical protein
VAPHTADTEDWMLLGFQFPVEDGLSEVELICEVEGYRGEAWFDSESLRLVRE